MKKHLSTLLFFLTALFLFVGGSDSVTSSSLPQSDRLELVVANITVPTEQNTDDNSCDVDEGDEADDDCRAEQQDLSADFHKHSLNLSSTAKFLPDVVCDILGSSLDVSLIPNRAPPSLDQSA